MTILRQMCEAVHTGGVPGSTMFLFALVGVDKQGTCHHDQKHRCRSCYPQSLCFCRPSGSTDSSSPRDERKCRCGRDSDHGCYQQQRPRHVSQKSTRRRVQSEERLPIEWGHTGSFTVVAHATSGWLCM